MINRLSIASRYIRPSIRALTAASSSSSSKTFVGERTRYEEQLSKLRKIWAADFQDKKAQAAQVKKEEKDRIVLKRAKSLRIKRKQAQERQEQARAFRARMLEIYKARLIKNHILAEKRDAEQLKKNEMFVRDLEAESETWLSEDNIDALLTTDLFNKPSTTGLRTSASEHWKWFAITYPIEADRSAFNERFEGEAQWDAMARDTAEARSQLKVMLRDMLEEVITDGTQRENLATYVDRLEEVVPVQDEEVTEVFGRRG